MGCGCTAEAQLWPHGCLQGGKYSHNVSEAALATKPYCSPDMTAKQALKQVFTVGLLVAGCFVCCCQVSCAVGWLKHQQQHIEAVVISWCCFQHLISHLQRK